MTFVLGHLADSEDNPLIRGQVGSYAVFPTVGVRRAEEEEALLTNTGRVKVHPPGGQV